MFNRSMFAAVAAVALLASGCASVPMATDNRNAELQTFAAPPAGKAGLYVYRNSVVGQGIKRAVYLDGQLLGQTANKVYFYRELEPGRHELSTQSEFGSNDVAFNAQAGKHYFARQVIKVGLLSGRAGIEMVSEEEGRRNVLASRLAE